MKKVGMKMQPPRCKTPEEIRGELYSAIDSCIAYWEQQDVTSLEKMEGLVFSIFNMFDGTSSSIGCGFYLVPTCHPDDPEYFSNQGENWYPVNENTALYSDTINDDVCLHEEWINKK